MPKPEVWSICKSGRNIEVWLMDKPDNIDIYRRVGIPVAVAEGDGDYILIIDSDGTIGLRKIQNRLEL